MDVAGDQGRTPGPGAQPEEEHPPPALVAAQGPAWPRPLTIFTGRPKAAAKSKPTQPGPRLPGSERGAVRPPPGRGQPMVTASYCQSSARGRATVSTSPGGGEVLA